MQICKEISKLLSKNGWSQARLAEETGLKQASISRYISGKTEPRVSDAIKIAEVFDVTLEHLLTGVDAIWEGAVANENIAIMDDEGKQHSNYSRDLELENAVLKGKLDEARRALQIVVDSLEVSVENRENPKSSKDLGANMKVAEDAVDYNQDKKVSND